MNSNLDQSVLRQLDARRGDWQAVAEQSGVSYSWLSKFANGHINNPGYGTLMKLANALDAQQSPVTSTPVAHQSAQHGA